MDREPPPDPADAPKANPRRLDLTPILVLLAVLITIGLGFWLFPYALNYVHRQDCIALGREDCD